MNATGAIRHEADTAAMSLVILSAKNAWAIHELGWLAPRIIAPALDALGLHLNWVQLLRGS
jgi:hypothetical protein